MTVKTGHSGEQCNDNNFNNHRSSTESTFSGTPFETSNVVDKELISSSEENELTGTNNVDGNSQSISKKDTTNSYLPIYIGGGIALLELIIGGGLRFIIPKYPHGNLSNRLASLV